MKLLEPGLEINGFDISDYAITNAVPEVKKFLKIGNAKSLPYEDNSFDLVIFTEILEHLYESPINILENKNFSMNPEKI